MDIQWQMRAVNCKVVVQQQSEQFVALACPWMCGRPEQTMMNDEEVGFGRDSETDSGEAGVHGGGDPGHATAVRNLQTVNRAVPILHFSRAQFPVTVRYNFCKRCLCHNVRETIFSEKVKA